MLLQYEGKKNFAIFFNRELIARLGKESGFVQRKARKISPYHFVVGFLNSVCKGQNSFSGWATQISLLGRNCVSKQAVFDRLDQRAVVFAKSLVEAALLQQSVKQASSELFSMFSKVLLQDSTTLKLPQWLSAIFPGNHSRGEQKAVARIQSVIDLKAMRFIDFVLSSFVQNDQSASGSIVQWGQKGDLVIRDMGYFAMETFSMLSDRGIHFLSRLRFGVLLYDKKGHEIAWKTLLRKNKVTDQWVCIGRKNKLWVRLVMIPVPAKQREERVRKAKNDRDKRLNHSQEYYQWLGYQVYITTVSKDVWVPQQVAQAYRVRWQIEIIFKSWKTGFHMQDMLHEGCTNEYRVRVSIFLMLFLICLFMFKIYIPFKDYVEKKMKRQISLIKLTLFISRNLKDVFFIPPKRINEIVARHCCFEHRADRTNMTNLYKQIKN